MHSASTPRGVRQGNEFRVNSYTTELSAIPIRGHGRRRRLRRRVAEYRQDGSSFGVYAQRYTVSQRPAITASQFVWQTAPQRIEFTFDQDVSASLSTADLVLRNLTTGTTIPSSSIVMNWNAATRTATFRFPTLPNGGSLPDGRYRATLAAAGVSNAAGTTIAVDYALDFFFLAGDANHDGRVNLAGLQHPRRQLRPEPARLLAGRLQLRRPGEPDRLQHPRRPLRDDAGTERCGSPFGGEPVGRGRPGRSRPAEAAAELRAWPKSPQKNERFAPRWAMGGWQSKL